ncbi:outer membrane lipid asymmetry maintenance protein MlaD [Rhodobacter sp. KR11]|jgi:phospholipid/cholesterol/gamma-HCH transport system substrate-binding protein|uniref:outer membrane lipid asymmetry maintenance protein MlaD n=1 Tax=Rhodobacter sp. KR11 TaxID=2974588 RepID=UPI002221F131|nr:outer membrane lipid asymmetry maintenance protein MlaD [Rhodobacter sp. KR11]MCW1919422.1 outer membrane lipid asymmetry maintenance protein MlaD [Rhodobacter sp. KR11]
MAENRLEIAAGALVLVAALGFAAYAGKGMGLTQGGDAYQLRASFRSIQGVGLGSDVKLAGVKVGTLSQLTLNPETYMADAVITVDKSVQLPSDSAILISSDGLLGGSFVELQPGGMPDYLAPGDEIEDTQGAVSLITLLMKFVGAKSDESAK